MQLRTCVEAHWTDAGMIRERKKRSSSWRCARGVWAWPPFELACALCAWRKNKKEGRRVSRLRSSPRAPPPRPPPEARSVRGAQACDVCVGVVVMVWWVVRGPSNAPSFS